MLLLAPRRPAAALATFFTLYFFFYVADGIASVSWLDILGKSLAPGLRARLISVGQAGAGIAGVGAGILVGIILTSRRLPYPSNYALLMGLGALMFVLSVVSFAFMKEEPELTGARPLPWRDYFRRLWGILGSDGDFRRAVIVQLLFSLTGAATPFYVIHGLGSLGFGELSVGIFTSAQVAGGVVSALFMGRVGERSGTRAVMRLGGGMSLAAPLLALAVPLAAPLVPSAALMYVYAIVFMLVGAQTNSTMAGFLNYVLESAPASTGRCTSGSQTRRAASRSSRRSSAARSSPPSGRTPRCSSPRRLVRSPASCCPCACQSPVTDRCPPSAASDGAARSPVL